MEGGNQLAKQHKTKGSLLQGDGNYFNKIISRESSLGQSSHHNKYYYRQPEGVPFKWEMQPGTPKLKAEEEIIPPPCPSPLMQSQGLPKPSSFLTNSPPPSGDYRRPTKWLGKKFKEIQRSTHKFVQKSGMRKSNPPQIGHSNREFSASNNSFSSLSSSSLSDFHGRAIEKEQEDGHPTCNLNWNMSKILVRVIKRI
ncbi:hypothetical protein LIER_00099 [Lithospermum erythrorhizon]|uniref:Uncharacterized protein n=1 Tax=Lithospermum erythrorhizon TaxID=34254 RepID=A0AAV3NIN1_LITER